MIQGISYWSIEGGLANTRPIEEALAETKAAGFQAMELGIAPEGAIHTRSTQADCEAVRKSIDKSGLVVQTLASGMSWGANPVSNDPAVREHGLALHEAALQRAAWLGCEAMLFVPGVVTSPICPDEKVRYDHALERARTGIERLLKTAEQVGVDLCIENVWNGLFYSPLELAEFVDSFGSDRLGVYLDVGNLAGDHQHPPHWVELLGERIKRVHIKDFVENFGFVGGYHFCDIGAGQVPWDQTIAALRTIGYDKTIIAEMIPPDPTLLSRTQTAMAAIIG